MFSSSRVFKAKRQVANLPPVISSWRRKTRVAVAGVMAVWTVLGISSRPAHVQTQTLKMEKAARKVTVKAADKSTRLVHLKDGYDLPAAFGGDAQGNVAAGLGNPLSMASADFDEDGVADLVVGYTGGKLSLYRGNVDSLRPRSHAAQQRKASGQFTDEPFLPNAQVLDVPESPEMIEAGDFNADGHKDILVSARNSNSIYLLSGTGKGAFQASTQIEVKGQVTAMVAGEIGQADGQTDVALAVNTKDGARLLVYEHPESAFKHPPEVFPLPAPATEIALGDFDGDSYSDIAVASGEVLTVIHERGQAYPWDIVKGVEIKRPPAIVETRTMPFGIAGLAVGQFGDERGNSLALLAGDGSVSILEPTKLKPIRRVSAAALKDTVGPRFVPNGIDASGLVIKSDKADRAESSGAALFDPSQPLSKNLEALTKKRAEETAAKKLTKEQFEQEKAASKAQAVVMRERAKNAFLQTISARVSTLSRWTLKANIANTGAGMSGLPSGKRLVVARVSLSGKDDLVVTNSASNQVNIVAQSDLRQNPQALSHNAQAEVVSLDVTGSPVAVLPMKLNSDALSDLVVLRNGSAAPSVVLSAPSQIITVNDTGDTDVNCVISLTCTLRAAMEIANHDPGTEIDFNISPGGLQTIELFSELPAITANGTVIDGSTQPDPGDTNGHLIVLNGIHTDTVADGFKIRASNCKVGDMTINGFKGNPIGGSTLGGNGITLETARNMPINGHNVIVANLLGPGANGQEASVGGNDGAGLNIFTSDNNEVTFNQLSDNGAGLAVTNGNSNTFLLNTIGGAGDGVSELGNDYYGVFLTGSNNKFGGDGAFDANFVRGNGKPRPAGDPDPGCDGSGMLIPVLVDVDTGTPLTKLNLIKGNRIGGSGQLGNCSQGIETDPFAETVIGSITPGGRNIISGNGFDAIHCFDNFGSYGGFCRIAGNNIGTDVTGTIAIPNTAANERGGLQRTYGIVDIENNVSVSNFGAPGGTTFGGACTGFCNLLSGNNADTPNATLLTDLYGEIGIFNNYIGTNQSGTAALGNANGEASSSAPLGNANDTFIGGLSTSGASLGNVISGNGGGYYMTDISLIYSHYGSTFTFESNLVGTDASGLNAISNGCQDCGSPGVIVNTQGLAEIGSTDDLGGNIISGNTLGDADESAGLYLQQDGGDYYVTNNDIGVNAAGDPLGNGGAGIELHAPPFGYLGTITVGGGSDAGVNVIAYNSGPGILVDGPTFGATLGQNSIGANGGLGIDLSETFGPDGVTDNDCLDLDDGPNGFQNFPELDAPTANGNGTISVPGKLFSEPNEDYKLDFYSSSAADPSGYGEGIVYIGTTTVHTNVHGKATFTFTSPNPVSITKKITAIALDNTGAFSEFSCVAGLCVDEEPDCPEAIIVNDDGDEPNDPGDPDICDIDPTTPENQCTLRAAIEVANHQVSSGGATETFIEFDIPGAGIHTILPETPLPDIAHRMTIDATSQPGYNGTPLIELSGEDVGSGVAGFKITGGGVTIKGFNINHFANGDGIRIEGGTGHNHVDSCFIGTDPDGMELDGHMIHGILVNNSSSNIIGAGTAAADDDGNIIAGCNTNVLIQGANSQNNVVAGNNFDLALDNQTDLQNPDGVGVTVTGGAQNNTIGAGSTDAQRNKFFTELIGVLLTDGAKTNHVTNNDFATCHVGISITRSSDNIVGGNRATDRNLIGDSDIGIYLSDNDPEGPTAASRSRKSAGSATAGQSPPKTRPNLSGWLSSQSPTRTSTTATTGNSIQGNEIGVSLQDSMGTGIEIDAATYNLIGGSNNALGNQIGFCEQEGIQLKFNATNNTLQHNYIGLDGETNAPLPNITGVLITGSDNSLKFNTISGNDSSGVYIFGSRNTLTANFVGTNDVAADDVPNHGSGVTLDGGGTLNIIGPNNVISGNTTSGVEVREGVSQVTITGNLIGTNQAGTAEIGNDAGITIHGSAITVSNNTISGNNTGIEIGKFGSQSPLVQNNIIQGNRIGTTSNGTAAIPNTEAGVVINNGADHNVIGAIVNINNDPIELVNGINPAGNLISGNKKGVVIEPGDSDEAISPLANKIQGNLIGTDKTGTVEVANEEDGILIVDSTQNLIGGFETDIPIARNVISGNGTNGVEIDGASSSQNRVSGNFIGTQLDGVNALGNTGAGVILGSGAHDNIIGGTEQNAGNTIAFNGIGVELAADAGNGNLIDPNSIFGNTHLGIELGGSGAALPNDPGDSDSGPNKLQNYPEFTSAIINGAGNLILVYKVDSHPFNSHYDPDGLYIEIFKADASLQGKTFIGSTHYTGDDYNNGSPGRANFNAGNAASLNIHVGDKLVATATDTDGNTSEFTSVNVGIVSAPTATNGAIRGVVTDGSGHAVEGVTMHLSGSQDRLGVTDAQGKYQFLGVETNGFCTIEPSRANFEFSPAQRSFSQLGNQTNAAFTATPTGNSQNPLDATGYFVRQQYLDFLGREPDEAGLNFWYNNIERCGTDNDCRADQRLNTSAAFFLSIEFQQTGYLVYRAHQAAFGALPNAPVPIRLSEFMSDRAEIASGVVVNQTGWEAVLERNRQAYLADFVQRPSFASAFPVAMTPAEFVDKLCVNAGVTLSESDRTAIISEFGSASTSADLAARGRALRRVAENPVLAQQQFTRAFVLMQYFGYLRRDPNSGPDSDYSGYDFWLDKLNTFAGNYQRAEMVKAFLVSGEYRQRFPN